MSGNDIQHEGILYLVKMAIMVDHDGHPQLLHVPLMLYFFISSKH